MSQLWWGRAAALLVLVLYAASFGFPVFLVDGRRPARSLAFEVMADGCQFPEIVALVIPFAAIVNALLLAGAVCLLTRSRVPAAVLGVLAGFGGWALVYGVLDEAIAESPNMAYGPGMYLWFSCAALLLIGAVAAQACAPRTTPAA